MTRAALPWAALLVSVAGCSSVTPLGEVLPEESPPRLELDRTPFYAQDDHQCGPAALAMALGTTGVDVDPAELSAQLFLPGRQGSLQVEMLGSARRQGRLAYVLSPDIAAPLAELAAGHPVVVLQNLGVESYPLWHYAVLIGYDAARGHALLRSGTEQRLAMPWSRFVGSWDRGGRWSMVVLEPGSVPGSAELLPYVEAAAGLADVDPAAGERALRAATVRWPDEPIAWLGVGNAAYAAGRLDEAIDSFARAVQLGPRNAATRNNLAQALLDAGCVPEARREARRALELAAATPLAAAIAHTLADAEATRPPGSRPALCQAQVEAQP